MIKRLHHASVGVRDPEMMDKMVHFYRDLLGFEVAGEVEYPEGPIVDRFVDLESVKLRVVQLKCPGTESWWDGGVELCHYSSPEPVGWRGGGRQCDGGWIHLALVVENLADMHGRLVKAGVRFNSEPVNTGQNLIVYMRDPDGNTVELMERLS